jgi:hypothetical protein
MRTAASAWIGLSVLGMCAALTPGLWAEGKPVSPVERAALLALYAATDGSHWTRHDGWGGPPGSECDWYGVVCATVGSQAGGLVRAVTDVELPGNGLRGSVPPELGALVHLRRLVLDGNKVDGPLPAVLLRAWDQGILRLRPLSLLHDVQEVVYVAGNPALRCPWYRVVFMPDGVLRRLDAECGKTTAGLRCEARQGRSNDFDVLARFLQTIDVNRLSDQPTPPSDTAQSILTVRRRAKAEGESARWSRGATLTAWAAEAVFEAVLQRAEWESAAQEVRCPAEVGDDASFEK